MKQSKLDYFALHSYDFDVEKAKNTDYRDIRWGFVNIHNVAGDLVTVCRIGSPTVNIYAHSRHFVRLGWSCGYEGVFPNITRQGVRVTAEELQRELFDCTGNIMFCLIERAVRHLERGYDALVVSFTINENFIFKAQRKSCRNCVRTNCDYDCCSVYCDKVRYFLQLFNIPAYIEMGKYQCEVIPYCGITKQLRCFKGFPNVCNNGDEYDWRFTKCNTDQYLI